MSLFAMGMLKQAGSLLPHEQSIGGEVPEKEVWSQLKKECAFA